MNKKGFIVVVTLIIISLLVVLTHQLLRGVWVGSSFIRTMVEREKAETLALSGVQIAIAQLVAHEEKEGKKKGGEQHAAPQSGQPGTQGAAPGGEKKQTPEQKFLTNILPHLNRWQVFDTSELLDGVDGQIKFCISCEHGKININEAFDFKKKQFKEAYDALLKGLELKGKFKAGEIAKKLTEFLSARQKKLYDISELNQLPGFDQIDIFYTPPKIPQVKSEWKTEPSVPNTDITIQDLFTTWTDNAEIEPVFFSDALCAVFGLRRPRADDAKMLQVKFKQVIDSFKPDWGGNWEENWKNIQPIYDEKPKVLSKISGIFSKQFEPSVYSVLSCGKVGHVEQRLLVIIKKVKKDQKDDQQDPAHVKAEEKDTQIGVLKAQGPFKILRAYWI